MNLNKHIKEHKKNLRKRSVCYLVKGEEVMLGLKKEGLGRGNYIGIGGKNEEGETIIETAIRELKEEIFIKPIVFEEMGAVRFYFEKTPDWNQEIIPFICTKWSGTPKESNEIRPVWFDREDIPYDEMWDDAKYWIHKVVYGEKVQADFLYDENNKVIEYRVR